MQKDYDTEEIEHRNTGAVVFVEESARHHTSAAEVCARHRHSDHKSRSGKEIGELHNKKAAWGKINAKGFGGEKFAG